MIDHLNYSTLTDRAAQVSSLSHLRVGSRVSDHNGLLGIHSHLLAYSQDATGIRFRLKSVIAICLNG